MELAACLADTYAEFVKVVERMWAETPEDRPPFDIILAELDDLFASEMSSGNSNPASQDDGSASTADLDKDKKVEPEKPEELRDGTTSEEEESSENQPEPLD